MHAKTETNAKILSLLYPTTPSRGVFKILKKNSENTMVFKNFEKKNKRYLASPTCGTFKNFEKKKKKNRYLASPTCGTYKNFEKKN